MTVQLHRGPVREGLGQAREQRLGGVALSVRQEALNSSAPNRLAVSVIATAGIAASRASAAIFSALIAPSLSE
jgi:hypothetical protein